MTALFNLEKGAYQGVLAYCPGQAALLCEAGHSLAVGSPCPSSLDEDCHRSRWVPIYDWVMATDRLDRVTIDPSICFGKPTVTGTRIWVGLVLGLLADGATVTEVLVDYPSLTEEDIRACLAYGARVASGHFVDVA